MRKALIVSLIILAVIGISFAIQFNQIPDNLNTNTHQLSARQRQLLAEPPLPTDAKIDKLIVYKAKREMQAFFEGKLIKTYPIALGKNPMGHKEFEGDLKTPEGIYTIHDRNPNSGYHKNLGISYPNDTDIAHASQYGKSAGGDIKIHGIKNGFGDVVGSQHLLKDWTQGCIAVTNEQIDELFVAVIDNAVIEILP